MSQNVIGIVILVSFKVWVIITQLEIGRLLSEYNQVLYSFFEVRNQNMYCETILTRISI